MCAYAKSQVAMIPPHSLVPFEPRGGPTLFQDAAGSLVWNEHHLSLPVTDLVDIYVIYKDTHQIALYNQNPREDEDSISFAMSDSWWDSQGCYEGEDILQP